MKRILVYLGHPAHFHLFKHVISKLRERGREVLVVIKKKDILEYLLESSGMSYENILSKDARSGKFVRFTSLIERYSKMLNKARKFKPDIILGTPIEVAHIGKILGIQSYIFQEDDWDIIPTYAKVAYPFVNNIISPVCCRMGKWNYKTIRYNSYHELAYLHPNHFKPNREIVKIFHKSEKPYFILRFVELNASHDEGIKGITNENALELIKILQKRGDVYITSERELNSDLEKFRITLDPLDIHHALAYARLFIGDSQTMAAESMVLGTPSLRFNDFVGRISYLDELENHYKLGYGFKTNQFFELKNTTEKLVDRKNLESEWIKKKEDMLKDKVDLVDFILEVIDS